MKRKLRPELDGDWWLIGPPSDSLDKVLPLEAPRAISRQGADQSQAAEEHNAPVDHHIFQGPDGAWHLWGCIRHTNVGRILCHWETSDIFKSPWTDTGEFFRCDHAAGECIEDWSGEEWLQSPYFIEVSGTYYMFYGGHATGPDANDGVVYNDEIMPCQMCLMTSIDGRNWVRHNDGNGLSRVFAGPGEVRDPCLLNVDGTWYCYYAGFADSDGEKPAFFCRTSTDLITWSDFKIVHQDLKLWPNRWGTECPHVVFRDGYYYMFRTQNYYEAKTHVFRSEDPLDFGIGDSADKYIGDFPAAAVEIYQIDGSEYVSSNHVPALGTQMCRMRWIEEK